MEHSPTNNLFPYPRRWARVSVLNCPRMLQVSLLLMTIMRNLRVSTLTNRLIAVMMSSFHFLGVSAIRTTWEHGYLWLSTVFMHVRTEMSSRHFHFYQTSLHICYQVQNLYATSFPNSCRLVRIPPSKHGMTLQQHPLPRRLQGETLSIVKLTAETGEYGYRQQ